MNTLVAEHDQSHGSIREETGGANTPDWSEQLHAVTSVCERAAQGDLEARITGYDPTSEFGTTCRAINHLLDIADS